MFELGKRGEVEMSKKSPQERELSEFRAKLDADLKNCSNVFIIGHNEPDFDVIGSAIGLYALAVHHDKQAYIIINDDEAKIEAGVKKIIDDNRDIIKIITRKEFLDRINEDSLLIITDTNKKNMVAVNEDLDKLNKVFIIDHHETNDYTIEKGTKYIDVTASSASEIIARILNATRMKYSGKIANYLLAGISLDTKRFKQNTSSITHDVAEKLINHGASIDDVNELFLEEFEDYCRINNFVIYGTSIRKIIKSAQVDTGSTNLDTINVSFTVNRNAPKTVYQKEDCAKAADKMLKFKGIDASFALGYVDENTVHISARSANGNKVDVGKILGECFGGGTAQSAGGRVETDDIFKVEDVLLKILQESIPNDKVEEIIEPKVLKIKR